MSNDICGTQGERVQHTPDGAEVRCPACGSDEVMRRGAGAGGVRPWPPLRCASCSHVFVALPADSAELRRALRILLNSIDKRLLVHPESSTALWAKSVLARAEGRVP